DAGEQIDGGRAHGQRRRLYEQAGGQPTEEGSHQDQRTPRGAQHRRPGTRWRLNWDALVSRHRGPGPSQRDGGERLVANTPNRLAPSIGRRSYPRRPRGGKHLNLARAGPDWETPILTDRYWLREAQTATMRRGGTREKTTALLGIPPVLGKETQIRGAR